MADKVDITPTPRILRTLGDIPFEGWQCLAELADNSLDAFLEAEKAGKKIISPRIDIYWSSETTPHADREIVVEDNGLGMTLDELRNAAKAGYTSNDPIHNLGLFGMGFNIATARLGDETRFMSATVDSDKWVGIKIDFEELISSKSFSAPVIEEEKKDSSESGTKIIIGKLKDGIFAELKNKATTIRRRLESIYSTILEQKRFEIYLKGNLLQAWPHCAWNEERYVTRKGVQVLAVQTIDRDLGDTYFDTLRNRYLTTDESTDLDVAVSKGSSIPANIVKRARRLKGWVGIQRYSDPTDFGLDFVRNGRKIQVGDKSVFQFENPATGNLVSEYPIELGSTVGGRIVGELHVDYLIPTYQKNGFDTSDMAWRLTLDAIRGAGPLLPKNRKTFDYTGENDSPLGVLVNAYRRADPGTKYLAVAKGVAKKFLKEFRSGNPEYRNDTKWYKAAQEADRQRGEGTGKSTPPSEGDTPSDEVEDYAPQAEEGPQTTPSSTPRPTVAPAPTTTPRDVLIQDSNKEESMSGEYAYGTTPPLIVTTRRLQEGQIKIEGERLPYHTFQDGVEVEFVYDPNHPVLAEYPITPKQLLLHVLAEKFSIRDGAVTKQKAFVGLVDGHLGEERIVVSALRERAQSIMGTIKDKLPGLLSHRLKKTLEIIKSVSWEEEELGKKLLDEAPSLLQQYQEAGDKSINALPYVNDSTVLRLIEAMPEEFLDGKLFDHPYASINLGDEETQVRLKAVSIKKVLSYMGDLATLLQSGKAQTKDELIRNANTMSILEGSLVP